MVDSEPGKVWDRGEAAQCQEREAAPGRPTMVADQQGASREGDCCLPRLVALRGQGRLHRRLWHSDQTDAGAVVVFACSKTASYIPDKQSDGSR